MSTRIIIMMLSASVLVLAVVAFMLWQRPENRPTTAAQSPTSAQSPTTAAQSTETALPTILSLNGTVLTTAEIQAIEQRHGVRLVPGRYWYDRNCGAWGSDGGPTRGFVMPGLAVGGELRADASAGNTGVFINGRELHQQDVIGLQQLGPVVPGRYWVDAYWNCGYEGGPALFNLAILMRAKSGGKSGGPWSATTKHFKDNTTVGGDGGDFMYVSGKDHNGNSYTYFP